MSSGQLEESFKRLRLAPGDCLVIKRGLVNDLYELRHSGIALPDQTVVFLVDELDDVRALDTAQMAELGWVRKGQSDDGQTNPST